MSWPFCFFRALPEVYGVSVISAKEGFYPSGEWYDNLLKRIDLGFKDFTGCSNGVCNDSNFMGVIITKP